MKCLPYYLILIGLTVFAGATDAAVMGTAFTYQGQLIKSGTPITGTCNVQFSLWTDVAAGVQVGTTQTVTGTSVSNGLISTPVDFGPGAFDGTARWIQIAVQGPGDVGYTTLTPRQAITPAPYALFSGSGAGSGSLALPYSGSVSSASAAFSLFNTNVGANAWGMFAKSDSSIGVFGQTLSSSSTAVLGRNEGAALGGNAVFGYGSGGAIGVLGLSERSDGVSGRTNGNGRSGVFGYGGGAGGWAINGYAPTTSTGVYGVSEQGTGVYGRSNSATGHAVDGYSPTTGDGVRGISEQGAGVYGRTAGASEGVFGQALGANASGVLGRNEDTGVNGTGVYGYAAGGAVGVLGISEQNNGLSGRTNGSGKSAVFGYTAIASSFGGLFTNAAAGGIALKADGIAQVKALQILGGADLAEPFNVSGAAGEPIVDAGMVVVIDGAHPGELKLADQAYDSKVAGVISGANGLEPGVVMKSAGQKAGDGRSPIALSGRVWCKADASYGAIHVGDLLTTSATAGMAMRAGDPARRMGAILGKAMTGLEQGRGLVLVLVTLE